MKLHTIIMGLALLGAVPCHADPSPQQALHEFKQAFQASLIQKLHQTPIGARIQLLCVRGHIVEGIYHGYMAYDASVWMRADGDIFQTGYSIEDVQDIRLVIRRQV